MILSPLQFAGRRCSTLLFAVTGVLALAGCEKDNAAPQPRLTVEVYEVGRAVTGGEGKFLGRVVPADLTRVAFRIPGKIGHLAVQSGQQVIDGQVLARIEDTLQRQVLEDASAQYKLSRRQLERGESLFELGSLTSSQRDQLQAGFRLAEANLRLAEAGLSYTVVNAPFDGTVAEVEKELYEEVTAGETVVTVYRNDRTDVLINIPDALPARAHQARDITATKAQVVFSGSETVYTMSFLKGSTARNPKTQAFQLWLTMPAPHAPFPHGLPATITTDLQKAGFSTDSGLVVPLTALEAGPATDAFRVWRYRDGTVQPAPVQVISISQDGALISGGLQAGDLVANSGLSRLSPGRAVDIQPQREGL